MDLLQNNYATTHYSLRLNNQKCLGYINELLKFNTYYSIFKYLNIYVNNNLYILLILFDVYFYFFKKRHITLPTSFGIFLLLLLIKVFLVKYFLGFYN